MRKTRVSETQYLIDGIRLFASEADKAVVARDYVRAVEALARIKLDAQTAINHVLAQQRARERRAAKV